jgi:hypothetical protein
MLTLHGVSVGLIYYLSTVKIVGTICQSAERSSVRYVWAEQQHGVLEPITIVPRNQLADFDGVLQLRYNVADAK